MKRHTPARARRVAASLREEGRPVEFRHQWRHFSGTLYEMPIEPTYKDLVAEANKAIEYAQSVRKAHARKTKRGSPQRGTDIKIASDRLYEAMKPIRRQVARLPYQKQVEGADELRAASEGLQRERRKLWKLKPKKKPVGRPKGTKEPPKPKEEWPKPVYDPKKYELKGEYT